MLVIFILSMGCRLERLPHWPLMQCCPCLSTKFCSCLPRNILDMNISSTFFENWRIERKKGTFFSCFIPWKWILLMLTWKTQISVDWRHRRHVCIFETRESHDFGKTLDLVIWFPLVKMEECIIMVVLPCGMLTQTSQPESRGRRWNNTSVCVTNDRR